MKCAIVSSRAIAESKRLEFRAGYYLGLVDGVEPQQAVEKRQLQADRAIDRLKDTIAEAVVASARSQRLIKEGKVVPYAGGK